MQERKKGRKGCLMKESRCQAEEVISKLAGTWKPEKDFFFNFYFFCDKVYIT